MQANIWMQYEHPRKEISGDSLYMQSAQLQPHTSFLPSGRSEDTVNYRGSITATSHAYTIAPISAKRLTRDEPPWYFPNSAPSDLYSSESFLLASSNLYLFGSSIKHDLYNICFMLQHTMQNSSKLFSAFAIHGGGKSSRVKKESRKTRKGQKDLGITSGCLNFDQNTQIVPTFLSKKLCSESLE